MKLGAPILRPFADAQQWIQIVQEKGYRAVFSPLSGAESDVEIDRYAAAARQAGVQIAEQGAWYHNCISRDDAERKTAVEFCARQLSVADRLGARCCVSLSGSRGEKWNAADADNLSEDVFALIVDNCRQIIDLAKPKFSFYTLEARPCAVPNSLESYERLIKAVDRDLFGVHYDPVNLVYSPFHYYNNGDYMKEFIKRLGSRIRSVHIKDVSLVDRNVFHLEEVIPGTGHLNYDVLLSRIEALDPDMPILLEHFQTEEEYDQGERFIRAKARSLCLTT